MSKAPSEALLIERRKLAERALDLEAENAALRRQLEELSDDGR